jgi:hypothetical protein
MQTAWLRHTLTAVALLVVTDSPMAFAVAPTVEAGLSEAHVASPGLELVARARIWLGLLWLHSVQIQSGCGADPDGNTICTNPGPSNVSPHSSYPPRR